MGHEDIIDQSTKRKIDGKEYEFKLKIRGSLLLAQKYGTVPNAHKALTSVFESSVESRFTESNIIIMCDWVHASLLWGNPELKTDDIYDLLDMNNIMTFFDGMLEAFLLASPKKVDSKGPPAKA